MKIFIYCGASLILAVLAASAIGDVPTRNRWGEDGLDSMTAVAVICLCTAVVAMAPMAVIAPRRPDYIGQAALAATVLRLLLTMAACVGYQVTADPHLPSFLFWATVFYLLLLAIETGFGVVAVRRFYRITPTKNEGAVS